MSHSWKWERERDAEYYLKNSQRSKHETIANPISQVTQGTNMNCKKHELEMIFIYTSNRVHISISNLLITRLTLPIKNITDSVIVLKQKTPVLIHTTSYRVYGYKTSIRNNHNSDSTELFHAAKINRKDNMIFHRNCHIPKIWLLRATSQWYYLLGRQ